MTPTSCALRASLFIYAATAGLAFAGDAALAAESHPAIPFDQIGAEAQKHYAGEGISITPTASGARLRAVLQDLEGDASADGLWMTSTADEDAGKPNRFRVRAVAFGRDASFTSTLPPAGFVHVMKDCAAFARPGVIEEYRVSTDGVRQDFVVLQRPAGSGGTLCVMLDVAGARAEAAPYGAKLTVDGTGRELAYSRLAVSDARGKRLTARMQVDAADRLRIEVEDSDAVYPVRIDPTFSDADWISMGAGLQGINGDVFALTTDSSGNLYVGGSFTRVGDKDAGGIAMWNGAAWSNLTGGMNGTVTALAIMGGNLYAGGSFVASGGFTFNRIAKWNGTAWSDLGSGMNGNVNAFAVIGTDLYVGGAFTSAGGILANRVARWDGAWHQMHFQAMDGPVNAFAVIGTDLYAGGAFTSAGGNPASAIAKWNGTAWSALPSEITGTVYALTVLGGDLYAGGSFVTAGGTTANRVAKWNGAAWSALGTGMPDGIVYALTTLNGNLMAGGSFNTNGTFPNSPLNLAQWNGSTWSALSGGQPVGEVRALTVMSGTDLYIGGIFSNVGGIRGKKLARWTGTTWWDVGYGLSDSVHALAVSGSDIYVGGAFKAVSGFFVNHIVKWDGASWYPLGTGVDGTVRTLAVSGSDVYAGGDFTNAGGAPASHVAKWNGTAWAALGDGADDTVKTLAISGSDLYAGGEFLNAGGAICNGVAKWDGTAWSNLGTGMTGAPSAVVHAIAISGSDVFAGGSFSSAGGVTASNIAKWNGSAWAALGAGTNNVVYALATSGSTVYAGGDFTSAGGVTANRIARWNGSSWIAMGSINAAVRVLAVSGSFLYAGGDFTLVNGTGHWGISRWNGSTWTALTDLNHGLNGPVYALAFTGSSVHAGGAFTRSDSYGSPSGVASWEGGEWSVWGRSSDGIISAMAMMGSDLYVGGTFGFVGGVAMGAGGLTTGNVARWSGSKWSYLGGGTIFNTGVNGPVTALAASGGILYVGGSFTNAGSLSVSRIAKWDGTAWSALGTGVSGPVNALAVSGSDLYVGGMFITAGGTPRSNIARWNGSVWSSMGSGFNGTVHALTVSGTDLYAGGAFTQSGAASMNRIAKWNGTAWSPLGTGASGLGSAVYALAVSGSDLYAAGNFNTAGSATSTGIARWDGANWNTMGPGFPQAVRALAVSGTNLYAAGEFRHTSGGLLVNHIAHWDGASWHDMGSGMDDTVLCLQVNDATLFAGGQFQYAGGEMSAYITRANIPGAFPLAELGSATAVTTTTATLHGTVNPNGMTTSALFEYSTAAGFFGTAAVALSPNNGSTAQSVSAPLSGLAHGTEYRYRLRAFGPDGSSSSAEGTFTTISSNADLSALVVQNCTITPAFSSGVTTYSGTTTRTTLVVRPTATHPSATLTVNGTSVASGANSQTINIPAGINPITIVVTAEDGVTTKTYTLNVNRDPVPGVLSINLAEGSTIWAKESDGVVNIPIRRSAGLDGQVTFELTTSNGTALAGQDYVTPTLGFVMNDQQATRDAAVVIMNPPSTNEGNETFTVTLANAGGGATVSGNHTVTVMILDSADTIAPSPPAFIYPATENSLINNFPYSSSINLIGTATDNKNIAKVELSANGAPFTEIEFTPYAGKTVNWTFSVNPVAAVNTIRVRSTDVRGNVSPISTRTFRIAAPLTVYVEPTMGSVTAGFANDTWKEVNKSYSITASPAPGYIFEGWTINSGQTAEEIGATPSGLEKATLTFIHRGPLLELTANFVANPYDDPGVAGTYNGLVHASTVPADNSLPGLGTEGYFTAALLNTGAFSGRLTIDGLVLNVAGVFDHLGHARFGTARAPTLTVPRTGKPSLVVRFDVGGSFGPSGSAEPAGTISGRVEAKQFLSGATPISVSVVKARRAHFTGVTPVLTVPDEYLTVTGTAPSPAGRSDGVFTVVLPSVPVGAQPLRVSSVLTEQDYPKGHGLGTMRVTKGGVVSFTGKLADGTAVTASGTLSDDLDAGLFAQLYSQKGFLSAPVKLNHTEVDSDLKEVATDHVLWCRPFNSTAHYYPYGWAETIELDLLGAKYGVAAGQHVMKAPDGPDSGNAGDTLQSADEDGNVTLTFSEGQLPEDEDLIKFANLTPGTGTTETVVKVPSNDPTFTMTVTRSSGMVTGTFTHTDTNVTSYSAVIIQKGPNAGAYGYFLTKQPVPIDYTGQSGEVSVIGQP